MNNYEEQLKTELKTIDKDNRALQQENIYLREKCKQLKTIVNEAIEYIEWHYKDNKEFYKNKGIGLNYPECDGLLNILQGSE